MRNQQGDDVLLLSLALPCCAGWRRSSATPALPARGLSSLRSRAGGRLIPVNGGRADAGVGGYIFKAHTHCSAPLSLSSNFGECPTNLQRVFSSFVQGGRM